MRLLLLAGLTLASIAMPALADDTPSFFISPMGEPFRGHDAPNIWFDQADTNHDGVLTLDEMEADAARFFATLDRNKDGEIDPDEIEIYETQIAPMISVGNAPPEASSSSDDSDAPAKKPVYVPQGAARFGYFNYPEPVIVADTNFDRGVDAREFRIAADKRFAMLDKNGDGKLEKSELPKLSPPGFGQGKRGGGRGGMGRHGGGRRGGGGMGGMSPGGMGSGGMGPGGMGPGGMGE